MIVVTSKYFIFCILISFSVFSLTCGPGSSETNTFKKADLLQAYPTTLTKGCTDPAKARTWSFCPQDIYQISDFTLAFGNDLHIDIESADMGIGHCKDGAVWAVIIPKTNGKMRRAGTSKPEEIEHVWLRFHPAEIDNLFPPKTIAKSGNEELFTRMMQIANLKMHSSWQAGGRAMIPERNDMTVDVETPNHIRFFFIADRNTDTAKYVPPFTKNSLPTTEKRFDKKLVETGFDQLWNEYDRKYAMFILRPEVDWEKLRQKYRPIALAVRTRYEFALICAKMLRHLRDLHIWVLYDGQYVPVYNRPRVRNSNPAAQAEIIGQLNRKGTQILWGKTPDKIGFIAIHAWAGGRELVDQFDEVLEQMRDTRGLIIDVRLNGGGSEPLAKDVAGRFTDRQATYAYSQYRNGPKHTDLTKKLPRGIEPRGPWRYDRPVIVLIGQKCMSSNESFVSMMDQCPQVMTMGDHTCGSSGNPTILSLPMGIRVSLPQWIDLLPDGTPLDERGIQPNIPFETRPEHFEGHRDDLLILAVERLKKEPVPDKPIPVSVQKTNQ